MEFYDKDIDRSLSLKYWSGRHMGIEGLNKVEWKRRNIFSDNWYEKIKDLLETQEMKTLGKTLLEERKRYKVFPAQEDVFRAFKLCIPEHIKVVIIGKNPYYQEGVADGLAFSYKKGKLQTHKKALDIIIQEIERDAYNGFHLPTDHDLTYLARQGVLLLNSSLTVRSGDAESHLDIGWQFFTRAIVKMIYNSKMPKVFMLWGDHARKLYTSAVTADILNNNHLVLTAKHPAYDVRVINSEPDKYPSLNFPDVFKGCGHFSRANQFLREHNRKEISWLPKDDS